tara:strand:- start:194 stop:433 length:240 start_codon:yes stop_codon:yes gene_type:complete
VVVEKVVSEPQQIFLVQHPQLQVMELVVHPLADILQVVEEAALKLEQLDPYPMVVEAVQVAQLVQQVLVPLIQVELVAV